MIFVFFHCANIFLFLDFLGLGTSKWDVSECCDFLFFNFFGFYIFFVFFRFPTSDLDCAEFCGFVFLGFSLFFEIFKISGLFEFLDFVDFRDCLMFQFSCIFRILVSSEI